MTGSQQFILTLTLLNKLPVKTALLQKEIYFCFFYLKTINRFAKTVRSTI